MKKILLVLLCLVLVLLPSCQPSIGTEIYKPPFVEPDYEPHNLTTITMYVGGKECKPNNTGLYEMYLPSLSKNKTYDSVTITVKNTGYEPAKISMSHREYIRNGSVSSELPDVLNPGESADIIFSYSVLADNGLLPSYELGNITLGGNFPSRFISFRGNKVDVPMISIQTNHEQGNFHNFISGMEMTPISIIEFNNYMATAFNQLVFQYSFLKESLLGCILDSIEITGRDAGYFTVSGIGDYFFGIEFNPTDRRAYEANLKLRIRFSDFKEYVREVPFRVDVVDVDKQALFVDGKFLLDDYRFSRVESITPRSDGHAFVKVGKSDAVGFIEIDENDRYVKWYDVDSLYCGGNVLYSWMDEESNVIYMVKNQNNYNDYNTDNVWVDSYVFTGESAELKHIEIGDIHNRPCYLGYSDDFLILKDSNVILLDKKTFKTIHTSLSGLEVKDVIYDSGSQSYVFAYDNSLWITQYDSGKSEFTEGRVLNLVNTFEGGIREIIYTGDCLYVINDKSVLYRVKINILNCEVSKIAEFPYDSFNMQYLDGLLYFTVVNSGKIYAYDLTKNKLWLMREASSSYWGNNYYSLKRNGKLYFMGTKSYNLDVGQGYLMRIPLV